MESKERLNKAKRLSKKKVAEIFDQFFGDQMVQYSIILFAVLFVLICVIFITERSSNSKINTFFDAFWYSLVTVTTVGYGDITPSTIGGRIAGLILLLFGVVAFGAISGKVASVLFDIQRKKDKGLIQLKTISNHFLICGWKPDFDLILDGIIAANPDIPLSKIVLINSAPLDKIEKIKAEDRFKGITWMYGDYTDEVILLRARVKFAERLLVLGDMSQNFSELEIDSRTVLAVLTVSNLNPKIYTAAELIDEKFRRHLAVAHCDEVIPSRSYERNLLVSASSGTGLSHVLRELITENSGEGLVIEDIPNSFTGKSYREYRCSLKTDGVLIGLIENTGNFFHRRKEALAEAQKNPDMTKIVSNLKKVKNLESNRPVLSPSDDYCIKHNSRAVFVRGRGSSSSDAIESSDATVLQ